MRVWLVHGGEYEQWYIAGTFSSLEKARDFCERHKNDGYLVYADEGELVDAPDEY